MGWCDWCGTSTLHQGQFSDRRGYQWATASTDMQFFEIQISPALILSNPMCAQRECSAAIPIAMTAGYGPALFPTALPAALAWQPNTTSDMPLLMFAVPADALYSHAVAAYRHGLLKGEVVLFTACSVRRHTRFCGWWCLHACGPGGGPWCDPPLCSGGVPSWRLLAVGSSCQLHGFLAEKPM